MSESSKSAGKNPELFRTGTLITATAIWSFATGAAAQDAATDRHTGRRRDHRRSGRNRFPREPERRARSEAGAVGSIDMIVAEDIADFPDLNLAESLQRVPGVVIARDAGEGRQISVRGLGPQFTRVRINGIEAMSANGSTDASGGTNRGRNFDFNTFASELFNNITVRKTASAEVEEGSLGATVDLRTGRPFDYDGFTIAGSAAGRLQRSDRRQRSARRIPRQQHVRRRQVRRAALGRLHRSQAGGRWFQHRALAARHRPRTARRRPTPAPMRTSPRWRRLHAAFVPRIPRFDKYEHDQERLGVTAALQFAPSEATSFSLDALYAKFDAERDEIFLEAPVFSTGGANTDSTSTRSTARNRRHNSLVYGVFNDVDIRSEARHDELTTKFTQVTLEGKHAFSDAFNMRALVGFRRSEPRQPGADHAAVRRARTSTATATTTVTTAACRSSPTARRTSRTRRPGRSRRSACARRARSTASRPRRSISSGQRPTRSS